EIVVKKLCLNIVHCTVRTGSFGGMDFYVVLGRRGERVAHRRRKTSRVGCPHRVRKEEAMHWFERT
uniref:60S ribosomal protein L11 n=1 Tax=Trypanosoma cruzi TaxID=5693 RepID=UPI00086491B6|nr:Chain L, 60S ribosomal protein L11 [Trypanosoma cruzi]